MILRKGDRVYIDDGVYGSFDELTLPGWNADHPVRVFTLDSKSRALPLPGVHLAVPRHGHLHTLTVPPRPIMLPANIGPNDFIVFDAMGAYSVAVRTTFNGFYPDTWAIIGN